MARRFAKYWDKLKEQKFIEIKLSTDSSTDEEEIDANIHNVAKTLRNNLSRCKNEDQFYRRDCPHAKLKVHIKADDLILIELDEQIRLSKNSKITLEDL